MRDLDRGGLNHSHGRNVIPPKDSIDQRKQQSVGMNGNAMFFFLFFSFQSPRLPFWRAINRWLLLFGQESTAVDDQARDGEDAESCRQWFAGLDGARNAAAGEHNRGKQGELDAVGLFLGDAEPSEAVLYTQTQTHRLSVEPSLAKQER